MRSGVLQEIGIPTSDISGETERHTLVAWGSDPWGQLLTLDSPGYRW